MQVIRRNGTVSPFDAGKISVAMTKAFLAVSGGQGVVDHAIREFGKLDILVNVAGGSGPIGKTGWETTEDEFDEIVAVWNGARSRLVR